MKKLLISVASLVALAMSIGCSTEASVTDDIGENGEPVDSTQEALTTLFYTENFDDGIANEGTYSTHKVGWCDTYIPVSSNTPLCMLGQTLRTNSSTIDPTVWVKKGNAACTGVRVDYSYYQFANASVSLQYQQSNDASEVCEKTGTFVTSTTHPTTQACSAKSVVIPFGASSGVYIRFEHPSTNGNAFWLDNVKLSMEGC